MTHSSNHTRSPAARSRSASRRTRGLSALLWLRKTSYWKMSGMGRDVLDLLLRRRQGFLSQADYSKENGEDLLCSDAAESPTEQSNKGERHDCNPSHNWEPTWMDDFEHAAEEDPKQPQHSARDGCPDHAGEQSDTPFELLGVIECRRRPVA